MTQQHWSRLIIVSCLSVLFVACGEDPSTTPISQPGMDMAEPDMTEPDMAEPDMAEPDMAEPDMAESDMAEPDMPVMVENPDVSGNWELRVYMDEALGEVVASFSLVNQMTSTEVLGTVEQAGEEERVTGTYSNAVLSLEWTAGGTIYQFSNGQFEGAQFRGGYGTAGLLQDAALVRP